MDNSEKVDTKTANRVLLAVAVVFTVLFIVPFIMESLGVESLGSNIKFYLGVSFAVAFVADKIYLNIINKRKTD